MEIELDNFFITTPLGLEEYILSETQSLFEKHNYAFTHSNTVRGGFSFQGKLNELARIIPLLKGATKVLLRIEKFKVRDTPKLYQKLSKIKWNKYLLGHCVDISASAIKSRLFDDRKIIKATQDAITKYYEANIPLKKDLERFEKAPRTEILLRIQNDECTVSIDLSGERLDRRNYKKMSGHAPIRENIAATLVSILLDKSSSKANLLIDPMCGSGTFLLEAASLECQSTHRDFYINYIPALRKMTPLKKLTPSTPKDIELYGFDKDPSIIEQAQDNLKNLQLKHDIKVDFATSDIFSADDKSEKFKESLIIINPPYDLRIKIDGSNKDFFEILYQSIKEKYSPKLIGMIVPDDIDFTSKKLALETIPFIHGGKNVSFLIF